MHSGHFGKASSLLSSPADELSSSYRKRPAGYDFSTSDRREMRPQHSRVVFVSDLRSNTCELEIKRAFQPFGKIDVILMIPYKHQALIEFNRSSDARELVESAKRGDRPTVGDKTVLVDFSRHSQVDIANEPFHTREPSNILAFAVFNSRVNFKCDAICKICEPFGFIQMCVITKEDNGITKAIVEFDKLEEACLAKPHLNGADMFPNCNSIRIDFGKRTSFEYVMSKEKVIDEYRYDYDYRPVVKRSRVSDSGHNGSGSGSYMLDNAFPRNDYNPEFPSDSSPSMSMMHRGGSRGHGHNNYSRDSTSSRRDYDHDQPLELPRQSILIVKGLSPEMNCDRLFNIFCLYGNVKTVKFVTNKEGLGIVEMMDPMSAQQVIDFLHGVELLGSVIRVSLSDQDKVKENTQDLRLKDGTVAMKHYDQLRLNRFMTPTQAAKNKPKRDISGLVLYYWGVPDNSDENTVHTVLRENGVDCPCKVTLQNPLGTSGWITFDSAADATDTICKVNHSVIIGDTKIKFNYAVADGSSRSKSDFNRIKSD